MKYFCCALTWGLAGIALAADRVAEFKPKIFHYEKANAPLNRILEELKKQTGFEVVADGMIKNRPISVDCKNVTFWAALEQIAKAADGAITFDDKAGKLRLAADEKTRYRATPLSIDGVFRVSARSVQSGIQFETGQRPTQLELSLSWEPGILMYLIGSFDQSITARDDLGRALHVVNNSTGRRPFTGPDAAPIVELENVPRDAKSIALLQGQFPVIAAARMLDFPFERPIASKDATDTKSQTQDGITVRLNSDFKEDSELWTARVELEYPKDGPKFESYEGGPLLQANNAWLTNASINGVVRYSDYELVSQGRVTTLKYRFQNPMRALGKPEDWTLHIRTPSRFIETDVRFKLENIPLP